MKNTSIKNLMNRAISKENKDLPTVDDLLKAYYQKGDHQGGDEKLEDGTYSSKKYII